MKPTELRHLSLFRPQLMGVAMLFVMCFHVGLPKGAFLYGLVRCGNVGVDMFLFLSGIGLWHSWTRHASLRRFFWRRYVRIYPAWLLVAALFYVSEYLRVGSNVHSPDVPNLVLNVLAGWSFWRADDGTFWFIPAVMMLYTFAPFYMMLVLHSPTYRWLPVLFMVWAAAVEYWTPAHQAVGHIEIFWSRIPIFLLGINCGRAVEERRELEPQALWLLAVTLVLSLSLCIYFENHWRGHFPLFIERMVYIPLTLSSLLLLCRAFVHSPSWLLRSLAFVGSISLEIYLVHAQFVLRHLSPLGLGHGVTLLLLVALSVPLAWVLSRMVGLLTSRLPQ